MQIYSKQERFQIFTEKEFKENGGNFTEVSFRASEVSCGKALATTTRLQPRMLSTRLEATYPGVFLF